MNALHDTTPSALGITTFSLTYYYPHGLQVLPPSTLLLPSWASGITTFSLTSYYPPQASGITTFSHITHATVVHPSVLYSWGSVFVQLWDSNFFFCGREDHGHSICGQALSLNKDFPAFQLRHCTGTVKMVRFNVNFKFPRCACAAAVHILFLCSWFSSSIFVAFIFLFTPPPYGSFRP